MNPHVLAKKVLGSSKELTTLASREEDAIAEEFAATQPAKSSQPINEFSELYLASKCFPTLFTNCGSGDPTAPGCKFKNKPSLLLSFRHLLNVAYKRKNSETGELEWYYPFAEHPRFLFWAHNFYKRQQAQSQARMFTSYHKRDKLQTVEDLQKELNTAGERMPVFLRKLQKFSSKITGSNAYWYQQLYNS